MLLKILLSSFLNLLTNYKKIYYLLFPHHSFLHSSFLMLILPLQLLPFLIINLPLLLFLHYNILQIYPNFAIFIHFFISVKFYTYSSYSLILLNYCYFIYLS